MVNKVEAQTIAQDVVSAFEHLCGKGESRGACYSIATLIQERIPSINIVGGFVRMPQGKMQHWWCELKDGTIIDPLAQMWMDEPYTHEKVEDAIPPGGEQW